MILKVDRGLDHIAKGVQEVEVAAGIGSQHVPEGFVAEFPDGAKHLVADKNVAGAVDHTGINVPEFAKEIGRKLRLAFDLLSGLAFFEVIFVTALGPFGEAPR